MKYRIGLIALAIVLAASVERLARRKKGRWKKLAKR